MIKKNNVKKLNSILLLFIIIIQLFSTLTYASAKKVGIISNNTIFNSDYSWSFKFISGVTTVQTYGMTNYDVDFLQLDKNGVSSSLSKDSYCCVRLTSNSQKNNVWIRYNNVGTYNGQIIDLKITLSDWNYLQPANTSANSLIGGVNYPTIYFGLKNLGVSPSSVPTIDSPVYTYTFYKHGTEQTISVKCHETFCDVDGREFLVPHSGIEEMYISQNSTLTITPSKVYRLQNGNLSGNDIVGWITCLINGSSFSFTYSRDQDIKGNSYYDVTKKVSANLRLSYGFSLNSNSLAPFQFTTPKKVANVQSVSGEDTFTYTISHHIPGESISYYYTKYVLTDNIPECFTIKGIKITDDTTKSKSSWFTTTTTNNVVKITATSSALSNASFYNNNFYFTITVQKKAGYDMSKWYNGTNCIVPNTATIDLASPTMSSARSESKKTNTVNIKCNFNINTSAINGEITGNQINILPDSNKTIYYKPGRGYRLLSVKVDNKEIDIIKYPTSYTFENILSDHKIEVIYEAILGSITVNKQGIFNNNLQGATFELYAKDDIYLGDKIIYKNGDLVDTLTTDESGVVTFNNKIYLGKYQLIESIAPSGYIRQEKGIDLEIVEDNLDIETTVINHLKVVLPNAGGYGSFIFIFIGFTLIIISLVTLNISNKKKKNNQR